MIYLDTSVLVAMFSNEQSATTIREWYDLVDGTRVATSDWTLSEFSSAIRIKERTGQLNTKQGLSVLRAFDQFASEGIRRLEVSRAAFERSASLIRTCNGLRAGDSLHLAVALESGADQFVTLDKVLLKAAQKAKLGVFGFNLT